MYLSFGFGLVLGILAGRLWWEKRRLRLGDRVRTKDGKVGTILKGWMYGDSEFLGYDGRMVTLMGDNYFEWDEAEVNCKRV